VIYSTVINVELGSKYIFTINDLLPKYEFTIPDFTKEVTIINGGDLGSSPEGRKMSQEL
jgi:hypothetical protein